MSFLDRLFGRRPERSTTPQRPVTSGEGASSSEKLTDEQAVERYRYLLRTASPDAIEEAHAEAFAQLTPEQRRQVLEGLSNDIPPQERTNGDDPRSLARMATRAEMRRPGTLENAFGRVGAGGTGVGFGGFMAGSFLSTIAGVVIGTAVADAIFDDGGGDQGETSDAEAAEGDQGNDEAGADYDSNAGDYDAADFGDSTDFGDFGGSEF